MGEKEVDEKKVAKEFDDAINAEAMNAAESEVAAHMDAVIERAKTTEGWNIRDVVSKVGVGVNEILDEHGIEGAKKEQAMDHLDNKLSKMLEEISEEKELNVIKNEELIEEEIRDHLDNKLSMLEEISEEKELNVIQNEEPIEEELKEELFAMENQVAAEIDAVMERVKATEGWDVTDEVSKVDVVVN